MLASSAVKAARSVGSQPAWTRPAWMRENSMSILTSFSSRWPLWWARVSRSRSASDSASPDWARVSSSGPSRSVSGVRNS